MASGQIFSLRPTPPGSTFAQYDTRAGGSTPAETYPVADFQDTADEFLDFVGVLQGYAGGGVTLTIKWSATSATTGDVVWGAAFRRLADDAEDADTSHTYDFNTVTATTASVSGEVDYTTITFTDGADMDSVADGELFILRIARDANNGSDTMTGDAELWMDALVLRET